MHLKKKFLFIWKEVRDPESWREMLILKGYLFVNFFIRSQNNDYLL